MKKLNTRLIFITGGSSGIGLATARALAAKGADIIIFARKKPALQKACAEIRKLASREKQVINFTQMDVSDEKSIERSIKEAVKKFGAPDILINCAGIGHADYFENIPLKTFDAVMKTNLYGTRNTIAALLPHMKKKGGHIVNVSSVAGLIPMFGYTVYGTSKYALVGFTECLRGELKQHGISVSLICPPEVDTRLVYEEAKTIPAEAKTIKKLAGFLKPEHVARVIVRAIEKNKFLVVPGFMAKYMHFNHRLTNGRTTRVVSDIFAWMARKNVMSEKKILKSDRLRDANQVKIIKKGYS